MQWLISFTYVFIFIHVKNILLVLLFIYFILPIKRKYVQNKTKQKMLLITNKPVSFYFIVKQTTSIFL